VFDYAFEILVVADELEGSGGPDAFDGVEVVAAEQNAEVDELVSLVLDSTYAVGDVLVPVLAPCPGPRAPCPDEFPGWALCAAR